MITNSGENYQRKKNGETNKQYLYRGRQSEPEARAIFHDLAQKLGGCCLFRLLGVPGKPTQRNVRQMRESHIDGGQKDQYDQYDHADYYLDLHIANIVNLESLIVNCHDTLVEHACGRRIDEPDKISVLRIDTLRRQKTAIFWSFQNLL